jgi:DNA-binding HxlR family transcriptional regulator
MVDDDYVDLESWSRTVQSPQACLEGVSQKSLSTTLKRLERNGIIAREVLGTKPPSVAYELTPLGRSLLPPLGAIHVWAYENMPKVEEARRLFDEAQA